MRRCYDRGWITTRDGNCSLRRTDKSTLYITPSGWRKTIIHPEHIIKIKILEDRTLRIPNGAHPSAELHMHYLLQIDAPETRAVLHVHPTHVVAAMYRGFDLQALAAQFPEIFRYTRVGPSVSLLPATSKELGDATAVCMGVDNGNLRYDIVGQNNHGVCSVAPDPWSAYEHIERLDHICEIVLKSGVSPEIVAAKPTLA